MQKRTFFIAFTLCALSLIAAVAAIVLAQFGAPTWVFLGLFAWLLTAGLPTLAAVLLVVKFWEGLPLGPFLVAAALLALTFQWAAVCLFRRGWSHLASRKPT